MGVPYGSIARLILLYLQTAAIRTNTPEMELGRSMKSWMERMSLTTGGKTYQLVSEQACRISSRRLTFFTDRENGAESRHNGAFVQEAISLSGIMDDNQPALWQDRVRLDDDFWRSLRDHPVPVREERRDRRVYLAGLAAARLAQDHIGKLAGHPCPVRGGLPPRAPDQTNVP
jgi:hypothetical protein